MLSLIVVVCGGLAVLQYRWTGALSRAEQVRLRAGLSDHVRRLSRAFDSEWRSQCRALVPDAAEIQAEGLEKAHQMRYASWAAQNRVHAFDRIGIAVPRDRDVVLYSLEAGGAMQPMQWPAHWESLHQAMRQRVTGARVIPRVDPNSMVVDFVVFDRPPRRGSPPPHELEWMIFDLRKDYLVRTLLPALVKQELNSDPEVVYDVSVRLTQPPNTLLFSTGPGFASFDKGADATAGLFSLRFGDMAERRRRGGNSTAGSRWSLSVRHRQGSLEAAVLHARVVNLVISMCLLALLGGAAIALVRNTVRSRRLAEMQMRFVVGVTHDLRTPLSAIRGAAFNLAGELVTDRAAIKQYAGMIERNAQQLTGMIENVLAYSASTHAAAPARTERFDPGELVRRTCASVGAVEVLIAEDLPELDGDPIALERALRNLLDNAMRHARDSGPITVSAVWNHEGLSLNGDVVIEVSDRGPGIPDAELPFLFEPFYRGEQALAGNIRGAGLGLSLVKEAVERHGGDVTARNNPTGGATFSMRVPAAEATQ